MLKVPQTAGDVFDRITILLLKVANSNRRVEALEELVKLSAAVAKQVEDDEWYTLNGYINELYDINDDLWDIEEEIRVAEDDDEKLRLLRQIHEKNRERSEVKNVINETMNSDVFEVKDYSTGDEEEDDDDEGAAAFPPSYGV